MKDFVMDGIQGGLGMDYCGFKNYMGIFTL